MPGENFDAAVEQRTTDNEQRTTDNGLSICQETMTIPPIWAQTEVGLRHTPGHDVCVFLAGSVNSGPGGDLWRARDVPAMRSVKGSTLLYIVPSRLRWGSFSSRAVERSQMGPRALGSAKNRHKNFAPGGGYK